ncbi:MAG: AI-2E family transporter [Allosphingosinicella sp.]
MDPMLPEEKGDARHLRQLRLLAFLLTLVALWMARSFLLQLVWAGTMAVALWPLYRRGAPPRGEAARRRILLPLAFTLATGLVLMLPLGIVAIEAARDSQAALDWVGAAQKQGVPPPSWLGGLPVLGGRALGWWRANLADPRGAAELLGQVDAAAVAKWTGAVAAQVAARSMFFLVTLLALFLMLRDGERLAGESVATARRFYGDFGERFVVRLGEAVRGAVNGTVFVAIGEGSLIGFAYALLGVPRPVLFAVATIAFAMLPFGAWFAFGVAAIVLLAGGHAVAAGILVAFGAAVMLIGDNFVQPALIGNTVRLPFLWAFVATFGGLESFGLVGLFIGPALMAAMLLVWQEWLGIADPAPRVRRRGRKAARSAST